MILDDERDALAAMSRRLALTPTTPGAQRLRHHALMDTVNAAIDIAFGSDGDAMTSIEGARSKLQNAKGVLQAA